MAEDCNDPSKRLKSDLLRWKIIAGSLMGLCVLVVVLLYPRNNSTLPAEDEAKKPGAASPNARPHPGFRAKNAEQRIEELRQWGILRPDVEEQLKKAAEKEKNYRETVEPKNPQPRAPAP
jgi:hypothetical protein